MIDTFDIAISGTSLHGVYIFWKSETALKA